MKKAKAKEVAKPCRDSGFWIDHAEICESDLEWLADVERLVLWNVTVPVGFFARLPKLWWLDLRGGSGSDLSVCAGASMLEFLEVNQVRGMTDLSQIAELKALRYLALYGLPKVTTIPSCESLNRLERAFLGQLKGLKSLGGLLDAPNLSEILLHKYVGVSSADVATIRAKPSMKYFHWAPDDVAASMREPVVERIALPDIRLGWPEDWFAARSRGSGRPSVNIDP